MRRLLASESVLPSFIRELRIEGHHEDDLLQIWVLRLIPRISRLESFSWDECDDTPTAILESVIAKWPDVRLTIDSEMGSLRAFGNSPGGPFRVWASCGRLHTLTVRLTPSFHVSEYSELRFQLLQALKESPNLKVLQLWDLAAVWNFGDHRPRGRLVPWAVDFKNGLDRFPRLEELSIKGSWEALFSREDLKEMGSRGLWNNLKILRTKPPDNILPSLLGCMPSLEVLETSSLDDRLDYLDEWKSSPAPLGVLKELQIEGPVLYFPRVGISRISETLTHLTLHNTDGFAHHRDGRDMSALTVGKREYGPSDIEEINQICPNLTHLTFDMWREGKWPYPFLDSLAQFKNVHDLSLFVEYSKRVGGRPAASRNACRHLFEYVQAHKIGKKLRRFVLMETPEAVYHYAEYLRSPIPHPTPVRDFVCAVTSKDVLSVHEEKYQYVSGHYLYTSGEPEKESELEFSWNSPASIREYLHWNWKARKSGHERIWRQAH